MYEFMILGQLACRPMHGYLIAKIIGDIIGPYRQVQWGALYPVLRRLEREGLILPQSASDGDDGRPRKVYAITDTGRERLHLHLMDTEHHLGEYATVFALKVSLFFLLSREERLRLCRHYAVYAQRNIDHSERERRDLCEIEMPFETEHRRDIVTVMDHSIARWHAERAWAEELIAQYGLEEAV